MYFYSGTAFEGEFVSQHNTVDTTVTITSDLYGDVKSYATLIKSALIKFAENWSIHGVQYEFTNVEDIMGGIGPVENDIPQVVGLAFDIQAVFEQQTEDGIIVTKSIKNYSDSMTDTSIASLLNNMRNNAVSGTVDVENGIYDFMPIQISIAFKELKSQYSKKNLTLYGGYQDKFEVYDVTTGVTMNRVYSTYNRDYVNVQINYIPGHTYHISSTFSNWFATTGLQLSFDWEGQLENLNANYLNLRPEHFAFWFGVFGSNVTRGINFRREEWYAGVQNLITSTYDAETCLKNVNTGGATTADTTKCYVGYLRYGYNEDDLQMTSNVFNTLSLPVGSTEAEATRSVLTNPATNFTFSCDNATTLRLFALFFV